MGAAARLPEAAVLGLRGFRVYKLQHQVVGLTLYTNADVGGVSHGVGRVKARVFWDDRLQTGNVSS